MVMLLLIFYYEEKWFYDVYELNWQGEMFVKSSIGYMVDNYFLLYFFIFMLFFGLFFDEEDEYVKVKIYIIDLYKDQLLVIIDQQCKEFQGLNLIMLEEIVVYLIGLGCLLVYWLLVII